jgi:hypothetical protein
VYCFVAPNKNAGISPVACVPSMARKYRRSIGGHAADSDFRSILNLQFGFPLARNRAPEYPHIGVPCCRREAESRGQVSADGVERCMHGLPRRLSRMLLRVLRSQVRSRTRSGPPKIGRSSVERFLTGEDCEQRCCVLAGNITSKWSWKSKRRPNQYTAGQGNGQVIHDRSSDAGVAQVWPLILSSRQVYLFIAVVLCT